MEESVSETVGGEDAEEHKMCAAASGKAGNDAKKGTSGASAVSGCRNASCDRDLDDNDTDNGDCKKADRDAAAVEATAADLEALIVSDPEEHDPELFRPIPRTDCPICMLPLPLNLVESMYMDCCGKTVCYGCMFENKGVINKANEKRAARRQPRIEHCCPFCRESLATMMEVQTSERRMEVGDAEAFFSLSLRLLSGKDVPMDEKRGLELLFRASELGSAKASLKVYFCYIEGDHGLEEDAAEARKYLEMAVKANDADAREILGIIEYKDGNKGLAYKHWLISAAAGQQASLDKIKEGYKDGHVSKEEFADTLRAFQSSLDEEMSEERTKVRKIIIGL